MTPRRAILVPGLWALGRYLAVRHRRRGVTPLARAWNGLYRLLWAPVSLAWRRVA